MEVTWLALRRGVPFSPNRDLIERGVGGDVDGGGFQIEGDGFFDVCASFGLGVADGRTAREFGADGGVGLGFCVVFDDYPELHAFSIVGESLHSRREWVVVDFKTDADLTDRRRQYERQLQWCAYALKEVTGWGARAVLMGV